MESEQKIQNAANAIISFTDSYIQNKQRKENEQSETESTPYPTKVTSYLLYLMDQIEYYNMSMQVIKIPKLLQSLSALSLYKIGTHIDLDVDRQRIKVRHWSRRCLWYFQYKGDEQVQSELVNLEYGRAMSIVISTAGGKGEERGEEIFQGVNFISRFLRELHIGRNNYRQPSFQPLTLLARRTQEHLVEEGAIEEIEAQMKTYSHFQREANEAKAATLNRFIHNN